MEPNRDWWARAVCTIVGIVLGILGTQQQHGQQIDRLNMQAVRFEATVGRLEVAVERLANARGIGKP